MYNTENIAKILPVSLKGKEILVLKTNYQEGVDSSC